MKTTYSILVMSVAITFKSIIADASIPTDGLIAYYPLDGNANDYSGNGNHATVHGAVPTTDRFGQAGGAYDFDGVDDFMVASVPQLPVGSSSRSISLWVKARPDPTKGASMVHWGAEENRRSFGVIINSSPYTWQGMTYGGGNDVNSGVVANTAWHHLLVTYQATTLSIYLDGALRGAIGIPIDTALTDLTIGAVAGGLRMHYPGIIDDVLIYDRALTESEVKTFYCADAPFDPNDGLVAYYPLNGDANDQSGNDNHATVHGAVLTTDRFGQSGGAYDFDGVDDFMVATVPQLPVGSSSRTIAVWAKARLEPRGVALVHWGAEDNRRSYGVIINSSPYTWQGMTYGGGNDVNSGVLADTAWHHVAVTYQATSLSIYLDGTLRGVMGIPIDTALTDLTIGAVAGGLRMLYPGIIDEVRIYNRALTACDVEKLYTQESLSPLLPRITGPASGTLQKINTPIPFTGTFVTSPEINIQEAYWTFTCANVSPIVVPASILGTFISGNIQFATPGVYSVKLTLVDSIGRTETANTVGDLPAVVVIYNPEGGFVTGGGWIWSPPGAFHPDLEEFAGLTGKATFGFVAKYQKGGIVPTGSTEFQFKAGDLNFSSTTYQWLVVAGSRSQFKGWGIINGEGPYGFLLTAIDGQLLHDENDRFRIKIYSEISGEEMVIYDNVLQGFQDSTVIGGGNILIHAK